MFIHRNIPAYVLLSDIRRALEPNISVIISLMTFNNTYKKVNYKENYIYQESD